MVYILKGTTDHTHTGWNSENPNFTSVDKGHCHEFCEDQAYTSPGGEDNHIHPVALNVSPHDRHEYNEERDRMIFDQPSMVALKPKKSKRLMKLGK